MILLTTEWVLMAFAIGASTTLENPLSTPVPDIFATAEPAAVPPSGALPVQDPQGDQVQSDGLHSSLHPEVLREEEDGKVRGVEEHVQVIVQLSVRQAVRGL